MSLATFSRCFWKIVPEYAQLYNWVQEIVHAIAKYIYYRRDSSSIFSSVLVVFALVGILSLLEFPSCLERVWPGNVSVSAV